ncbi:hypothetical protein TR75_04105 [Hydrogenibacillus schlegelii]|nr:hypothetical protein TR75_04105 [Hydrogenibacillus schlegelii]
MAEQGERHGQTDQPGAKASPKRRPEPLPKRRENLRRKPRMPKAFWRPARLFRRAGRLRQTGRPGRQGKRPRPQPRRQRPAGKKPVGDREVDLLRSRRPMRFGAGPLLKGLDRIEARSRDPRRNVRPAGADPDAKTADADA